jgi:F-type H+-transporting ATPase subunit b
MDEEFFVFFGFVIFICLLAYVGVHTKVNAALDKRAERIKAELAEASNLRAEAEAVLASFVRRRAEAEAEAAAVIAQAHAEAELLAKEAGERMAEFIRRRTKQAEEKIASAETQATSDVRAAAADAATKVATTVLKGETKGAFGDQLINKGISELNSLFH